MIKNNVIYFGYGTIGIRTGNGNILQLQEIVSGPKEVGQDLQAEKDVEYSTSFCLDMSLRDCHLLLSLLDEAQDTKVFTFKGYTFNYEKYNPVAVEMMRRSVNNILSHLLRLAAC